VQLTGGKIYFEHSKAKDSGAGLRHRHGGNEA